MVATMKHFFAALLLLTASAEAQTFGSSTVETTPAALTNVSNVFTPSCPTLGGGFAADNIIVTAASQSIALPASCPSSSVGLFVTFNICNGKSGTVPCNGTASGPFSPGIIFGAGYEFPASGQYAVSSTNGNNVSGAKDIVTCEVMGTTGPWSCGTPQYAMIGAGDAWQTPGSAGCNSNIALSNGNLTATQPTTASQFGCLANTSHTTGQYYFFLTATSSDTNSSWFGGIANASVNLATYLGADNNGISLKSGNFFFNNTNTSATGPTITTGTVIRFDIDLTNKQLGVNVSGTEYPSGCVITTPTGCYSFSTWAGGAAFPAFSGSGNAVDAATLNTSSGAGPGGSFVLWQ